MTLWHCIAGLGLNLAALEGRAIGLSETQEKQARLTAFEPVCSEVAPGLFLGGMAVATDLGKMQESGITHVVNAIDHLQKNSFPELFEYLSLALNGEHSPAPQCFRHPPQAIVPAVCQAGLQGRSPTA